MGAVINWGIMMPALQAKNGNCDTWDSTASGECPYWFDDATAASHYVSFQGYQIFTGLGVMLSDGIWTIGEIVVMLVFECRKARKNGQGDESKKEIPKIVGIEADLAELDELFLNDRLPVWLSPAGYVVFGSSCVLIMHYFFDIIW